MLSCHLNELMNGEADEQTTATAREVSRSKDEGRNRITQGIFGGRIEKGEDNREDYVEEETEKLEEEEEAVLCASLVIFLQFDVAMRFLVSIHRLNTAVRAESM